MQREIERETRHESLKTVERRSIVPEKPELSLESVSIESNARTHTHTHSPRTKRKFETKTKAEQPLPRIAPRRASPRPTPIDTRERFPNTRSIIPLPPPRSSCQGCQERRGRREKRATRRGGAVRARKSCLVCTGELWWCSVGHHVRARVPLTQHVS